MIATPRDATWFPFLCCSQPSNAEAVIGEVLHPDAKLSLNSINGLVRKHNSVQPSTGDRKRLYILASEWRNEVFDSHRDSASPRLRGNIACGQKIERKLDVQSDRNEGLLETNRQSRS